MISTAAAQSPPSPSVSTQAASLPVAPVVTPNQVIAQTIQPQIYMPEALKLQWWEVAGVLPSLAAIITVVVTAGSLFWNTTRQIASNREALEKTLIDSDKKAIEDRAHAASESKLDRAEAAARAKEDRDAKLELAKHETLLEARSRIYAEVLTDFQKVQVLISSLPSTPLDKPEDTTDLATMSASINKLWIWGEVESVWKVRELYSQVNEFFYAALPKARIIKSLRQSILHADKDIEFCNQEMIRLEQEKKHVNIVPTGLGVYMRNKSEDDRIDREYAELVRVKAGHMTYQNGRRIQLNKRLNAYLEFVIDRQSTLMDNINSLMASAREDVGLEGSSSILEAQSHDMSKRVRRAVEKMVEESEDDLT
jgi:hypothetical protein